MKYSVEYSRRAERDLREITSWYVERSGNIEVANKWADGFYTLVEGLAITADRHPPAREFEMVEGDLRELHYGSGKRLTHRIVYEIIDDRVLILRIRHSAQRDLTSDDI